MNFEFTPHAWEDYTYWQETDFDLVQKINELLRDIKRSPFKGLGKPEPLKNDLKGYWSRRITDEHRLVYKISGKPGEIQRCSVVQCRFHY